MEIIKNPHVDFLGKAKLFVALSVLVIGAGLAWIAAGHLRYGVEFSGGTQLILSFQRAPEIDRIRDAVTKVSPGAVIQTYGEAGSNKVLVRIIAPSRLRVFNSPCWGIPLDSWGWLIARMEHASPLSPTMERSKSGMLPPAQNASAFPPENSPRVGIAPQVSARMENTWRRAPLPILLKCGMWSPAKNC